MTYALSAGMHVCQSNLVYTISGAWQCFQQSFAGRTHDVSKEKIWYLNCHAQYLAVTNQYFSCFPVEVVLPSARWISWGSQSLQWRWFAMTKLLLQTGVCFKNALGNPCNIAGSGQLPDFWIVDSNTNTLHDVMNANISLGNSGASNCWTRQMKDVFLGYLQNGSTICKLLYKLQEAGYF